MTVRDLDKPSGYVPKTTTLENVERLKACYSRYDPIIWIRQRSRSYCQAILWVCETLTPSDDYCNGTDGRCRAMDEFSEITIKVQLQYKITRREEQ